MAYNQQSSYGASPNRSYHPQQRIYEAQQQYATPHNNYGSSDKRCDVVGHPPYQTPQPLVNEQFGSQDGNSRHQGRNVPQERGGRGGNNGYDLRTRQTDVRSPDRDMRRVLPPRRPFEPERQVYPNSRSQEESQPHTASIDGPEESQYSQHDQYFRHRGIKRPQLPYSELSAEPTFHHGKTGNPINDLSTGSEYDQSRDGRPLRHMYPTIINGNTNQSKQITVNHLQQDFADSYRQEIYHGRSTPGVELAKANTIQSQPGPEHYSGADASLHTAAVPFNNSRQ